MDENTGETIRDDSQTRNDSPALAGARNEAPGSESTLAGPSARTELPSDPLKRAVAQRREAEERILNQLRLFAALLEAIPNPVFYTGLDGHYIGCNQSFAQLVGLDVSAIVGRTIMDVWPGRDARIYYDRNKELLKTGGVQHYEDTIINSMGAIRDVIIQKAVYEHADGTLGGIVGVIVDISEQKKAEQDRLALLEQMQQTQRLESLGVLAGGVAHDFNNLLMVILGNIDLALKDLPKTSPVLELIENAKTASLRASDLTNQMLAYAGKGRLRMRNVHLNELVREMAQLLQVSLSRKADVQYDLGHELPPIEGDPGQLQQVLLNLITNASESLGCDSGTISVRTDVIMVDEKTLARTYLNDNLPAGRYVRLEVADSGNGIDEEHRPKIFEPFYTTKFTGRGLGLAAVLGIIRGHRGAIDVFSIPGDGSTFTVLLPAKTHQAETHPPATTQVESSWQGQGTVLLVDDEPAICKIGATMLQRLGFEVLVATDGEEALEIFQKQNEKIVLILLDLSMPKMDGQEACEKLREIRPDIRILLCTGHNELAMQGDVRTANPPIGFLHKPFDLDILSETLRKAME